VLKFPYAGKFTLYYTASGNTELYLNGKLAMQTINNKVARTYWFRMDSLTSVSNAVVVKRTTGLYSAATSLEWSSPTQTRTVVPESALYGSAVTIPISVPNNTVGFYYITIKDEATKVFEIRLPGTFKYSVFSSSGLFVEEGSASNYLKLGATYAAGTYVLQIKQKDIAAQSTLIK